MTFIARSSRLLLALALLAGCAAAQTYQTGGKCSKTSTPWTCTVTVSVTAGQNVVVGVGTLNGTGTTSSVTDTNGDTFSVCAGPNTSGVANSKTWLYCGVMGTTNASEIITISLANIGVSNDMEVAAAVYSGGYTLKDQEASSNTTGNATAWTTQNTPTTTIASELMVGFFFTSSSTTSFTATNSFTSRQSQTSLPAFMIEDKNLSSTGAYPATVTSGTSRAYSGLAVTLMAAVVADPTFSPVAGSYGSAQTVAISSITSGAVICYRTDGVPPGASTPGVCDPGSTLYSVPVNVSVNETVKAIGTKTAYANSAVASAAYVLTAAAPTCSIYPYSGHYPQIVLASTSPSPTFLYCVDTGNTCTPSSSYTVPVQVNATGYIRALTQVSGWSDSSVASCAYTITVPITQITGKTMLRGKTRIQ